MTEPQTLHSPLLSALPGVRHAFFTRRGGVSTGVYDSLNVGVGSNDAPEAVQENRARVAASLGVPLDHMLTCYQVHSALPVVANAPWLARPEADAVVTRASGLACTALSADCAPILLADASAGVVAAAHAGWKGALGGVIAATVAAMETQGARRGHIVAVVGPCIAQASYEVGADFEDRFRAETPGSERFFARGLATDKRQFDLPGFVLRRLAEAGIEQAEWIGHDTCAEADLFFSNRRGFLLGEPDYGRLISGIVLT
jgi:YfiH family protein